MIIFILGLCGISVILGFGLNYYWGRHRNSADSKLQEELQKLREDYHNYQAQVGEHVQKTHELLADYQHHFHKLQEHVFGAPQGPAKTELLDYAPNQNTQVIENDPNLGKLDDSSVGVADVADVAGVAGVVGEASTVDVADPPKDYA